VVEIIIGFFIAMYATKMWFYMDAYTDDFYLREYSSLISPDSWFAWHMKAISRWDAKSYQEAVVFWTMARKISPNEFKINLNLATALKVSGYNKEAEAFINIAEKNIIPGQEKTSQEIINKWREGEYAQVI
jgi:hypothetical protein